MAAGEREPGGRWREPLRRWAPLAGLVLAALAGGVAALLGHGRVADAIWAAATVATLLPKRSVDAARGCGTGTSAWTSSPFWR